MDDATIRRIAHVSAIAAINRYVGHAKQRPDYHAAIEHAKDIAVRVERVVEYKNISQVDFKPGL